MTAPLRPACTVVLCAPSDDGLRVLLVQRSQKTPFLPNAWVFPGGRVDVGDQLVDDPRVRGGGWAVRRMALPARLGVAVLVAGVRETYEETGIWLGDGSPPPEARAALLAGTLKFATLLKRYDCSLDLDRLMVGSWWVTPKDEARRYDTRFVIATLERAWAEPDTHEIVAARWVRPVDAARQPFDELPMAPPTWWVLRELAACRDVEEAVSVLASCPHRPIEPMRLQDNRLDVALPGHPSHPDAAQEGLPTRITLVDGRWRSSLGGHEVT